MPDQGNVAIFWDYENCAPPLSSQGYAIVNGIRRIAHIFGRVTTFKTYLDMSVQPQHSRSIIFRSELQSSGVSMIDCPHNGRKDVVDKMILVDMLAFAIDHHSPATVILVAGDRDYAYAMSTLRLRQYTVVLIVPSAHVPESLVSQASVVIDWNYAILRNRPDIDTPPVRQPYRDLDEDILERLVREIQDPNEDPAVTLISSSRHTATAAADIHTHVAQPAPTNMPKIFPETFGHHRVGSAASRARSTTQSTHAVSDIDQDPASPSTANDTLSDGGVTDDRVSTANEIQDASHDPLAKLPIMSPRLGRYHEIAEPGSPPVVNFSPSPPPSATFNTPSHSRTISGGTPLSYNNTLSQRTVPAMPSQPMPTARQSDATSALKSAHTCSVSAIMDDSILPSDHAAVMDALGLDDDDNYDNDEIATNVSTDSPRLTEVDNDPSRTYVTNAVSSHFNHDIARSPANNTSPPVTEPSGIPGSQRSSLTRSAPDLHITTPNVVTGSPPQATPSVISDNSSHDSSGYQSFSMESVEDRIRRLTPPQFLPLINQLLLARSKGNMRPEKLMIATALLRHQTNVYKLAGVSNFWSYIMQAEQASLIEHGGINDTWIGLHPNLFKEETMIESVEDKIRRLTPPRFLPLINQLLLVRSKGIVKPGRSRIAVALVQGDKDVYKRVGVTNFWDYVTQAEQAYLLELGGREADPWISLHPNLYKEKTTLRSSIPSTAHINSSPAPHDNIEAKIRRRTPPQFLSLIDQLLLARSQGIMKLGMSTVAVALIREGVTTFWEYVTQAEQASLIELGGWEGGAWISLHPDLFKEETTLKSLTPQPAHSSSSAAPSYTVNTSTLSTSSLPRATATNSKISPLPAMVDPLYFQPLIACLSNIHRGGMRYALRSTVGLILGPAVCARAGVGSMGEYFALAVDAGIVEIGEADGHPQAWVRLHPDVLSGKRTF